ncbi:hypothetical protein QFC22_002653 [Naganishia vaughanmartiniae]|uniref:Uncharacterized protein n=1 Tax=Naganishia vaughanmartiniae TaxID=1424756 RepID=A0ACC2XDB1_9TREE|nr:hypothetical protein QFC22_002653 [Naganishia vaughanmartiniae]
MSASKLANPSSAQDVHQSAPSTSSKEVDTYRLGTRNSQLALVQTHHVAALLKSLHPGDSLQFPVTPMSVLGDRNKTSPLYLLSGDNQAIGAATNGEPIAGVKAGAVPAKSLWTEELEVALMKGELDMIIHCLKDMPTTVPKDCEIAAILPREDPHDALVVKKGLHYKSLADLPDGSVVGTSSVRRIAQLRRVYPKLKVMDVVSLRFQSASQSPWYSYDGLAFLSDCVVFCSEEICNDTRLKKLDDPTGPYTALILAAAGLNRLGWEDRVTCTLKAPEVLYAVGQGALALEIRAGDRRVKRILQGAGDWQAEWTTAAERGLLNELEGGCSVPVGVDCYIEEVATGSETTSVPRPFDKDPETPTFDSPLLWQSGFGKHAILHLTACVTSIDGQKQVTYDAGKVLLKSHQEAGEWGHRVARELMAKGAKEILDEINEIRREREEADRHAAMQAKMQVETS